MALSTRDHMADVNQPKQLRSQETVQRILIACCECVATLGYNQASTIKIAKQAGVSQGGLFKHFPTKISLMATMVTYVEAQARAESLENIPQDLAQQSIEKRVRYFIDRNWAFCQSSGFKALEEVLSQIHFNSELKHALGPAMRKDLQAGDLATLIPELPNDPSIQFLSQMAYGAIEHLAFNAVVADDKLIEFRLDYLSQLLYRELTLLLPA